MRYINDWSSEIADSVPISISEFRGIQQFQGDWEYCRRFNTKFISSIQPVEILRSSDWIEFELLQKYTVGESFFLCFPAAVKFGYETMTGNREEKIYTPWTEYYLHSQTVASTNRGETSKLKYTSEIFADELQANYKVDIFQMRYAEELRKHIQLLDQGTNKLLVVQIACALPMYGNAMYGHYVSISAVDNDEIKISGSLAPFGIYDTHTAKVLISEFLRFVQISNQIKLRMKRLDRNVLKDQISESGFEVMTILI